MFYSFRVSARVVMSACTTLALLLAICATFNSFSRPCFAVTMTWSSVGNPGNTANPILQSDGTSGYGAVDYTYNIGTYDVTNSQYAEFLNAKDPTGANALGLYNSQMATNSTGGIVYSATNASGDKYNVIPGDGNHPVTLVTWFDALRFANWMNNGQGNGDTESGAYTLLGGTPTPSNADSITRSATATIFLPSENEWYKAAYYSPATHAYFQYPTSSNVAPNATGPTAVSNSANYSSFPRGVTDVGAYTGTTSPYGAFDMAGNVNQWTETPKNSTNTVIQGGSFFSPAEGLLDSFRDYIDPTQPNFVTGFRLASVPEPATFILAGLGGLALLAMRRRR